MIKVKLAGALLLAMSGAAGAQPTPAQQQLTQCVRDRTTGADRMLAARWFLGALAGTRAAVGVIVVDPTARVQANKAFAALVTRLTTRDCLAEMKPLVKINAAEAFHLAGEALGAVAMDEAMNDPTAEKAIGDYTQYLSEPDFKTLFSEIPAQGK